MIIVDFSPVVHAGWYVSSKELAEPTLELVRHLTLNTIRSYTARWKQKYGETVLAMDHGSWRYDVFPQYKGDRKKNREESEINWELLFSYMKIIQDELEEFYPGRVIRVKKCEGDDVIATLCKEFHTQEEILIISPDNDMRQLLKYPGVSHYSTITKTFHTLKRSTPKQERSGILDSLSDLLEEVTSIDLDDFFS